jgi:hypothetical protein
LVAGNNIQRPTKQINETLVDFIKLQTTCGRKLQDNHFGEDSVSVEIMGLFEHYETLGLQRCVKPKKAAQWLIQYWNSSGLSLGDVCVSAFSNPFPWYVMVLPLGLIALAVFIALVLCCINSSNIGAFEIDAAFMSKNK